jgi:zinc and cadmium transporter
VCLATLGWSEASLKARIPILISIASGVLLGEAVFHLLPEAVRAGVSVGVSASSCILGIVLSFLIELWCKVLFKEGPAPVARISLLAESIHNTIDGIVIAAGYIAGIRLGCMATLAILIHELPHELGNFSVLVHGGYDRRKALLLNCLSAGSSIVGALAVVIAGHSLSAYARFILPPSAGCFIYIAAFDLLPSLWKESAGTQRAAVGYGVAAGGSFILILTLTG